MLLGEEEIGQGPISIGASFCRQNHRGIDVDVKGVDGKHVVYFLFGVQVFGRYSVGGKRIGKTKKAARWCSLAAFIQGHGGAGGI